jgi:hypothetical protein
LKNIILIATLGAALCGAAFAQSAQSFSANDIKVAGTLNSGQTSQLVQYSRPGQYRAFVFEGNGHDVIDVTVTGANGKAYVALADSTLMPVASGIGRLTATLPYHGPDIEAFYILVKPTSAGPTRFTVHLKKAPGAPQTQAVVQPVDATR